ncbi:MAG: hypothetical protein OXI87_10975 [Albidovulum sp.]|nr:hypothetical protein [Albidovulum sp.]MDE0305385.1 hypothetical protein [Albidovulum sp.]MDE0534618.1 hypothetical protein [Albidovulum sp.]
MVYSTSLPENQFGCGIVVPCKKRASGIDDLVEEAKRLWAAERNKEWDKLTAKQKKISADWGCVGILKNPESKSEELLNGWTKHFCGAGCYDRLEGDKVKKSFVIDKSGCLNLNMHWDWKLGDDLHIDVLLAAATVPNFDGDEYPTAKNIADAWKTLKGKDHVDYFCKNRAYGITTFQDNEIKKLI